MKCPLLIFPLLILLLSCRKDPPKPAYCNCISEINNTSSAYFHNEKYDFAYQVIAADSNHIGHNKMVLDLETVYYYLGRLSAIYQKAKDTTGSLHDMIFKYSVHNETQVVSLSSLSIKFKENSQLKDELINHPGNTSNEFLNALHNRYGFECSTLSLLPNTIHLHSDSKYNVNYIKNKIEAIEEVEVVYLIANMIDGSIINYEKIENTDQFIFNYGWGDCLSGCYKRHYWKIHVAPNCKVQLVEEYGDDLPE